MEILEAMKLKLLKVKLKSKSKLELNVNEKFRFCALALVALVCVLGTGSPVVAFDEKDDPVPAMVAQYKLEPLPEEDASYTVNLGYYNCDHMTAACIGKDSGIFKALGMKVKITGNRKIPKAMSAGRMDMAYAD